MKNKHWILGFLASVESISIGVIHKSEYRPVSQDPIIINGTCDECLCQSLWHNNTYLYVAFNCFEHDKRCEFYHNYSSWYRMVDSSNSRFFFHRQPPPLPVCYRKIFLRLILRVTHNFSDWNHFQKTQPRISISIQH